MKHTALVKAVKRGDVIEARRLLASGADPNEGSFPLYTPLHVAVTRGNTPIVELLLAAGAKPDPYAVYIAAYANHARTLRLLLASGVATDAPAAPTPLLNSLKWSGFTRDEQKRVRELLHESGARELPDWYLRWRWSVMYGWRWRLRRLLYSIGWLPRPRRRSH
jgi:ankyrin repeat protein